MGYFWARQLKRPHSVLKAGERPCKKIFCLKNVCFSAWCGAWHWGRVSTGSDGFCLLASWSRMNSTALCRAELDCFMYIFMYDIIYYNIPEMQKLSLLAAEHFQSASAPSCQSWVRTGSGFPASGVNEMEEDSAANRSTTSACVLLKQLSCTVVQCKALVELRVIYCSEQIWLRTQQTHFHV